MADRFKVTLQGKEYLVRDETLDYTSLERVMFDNEYLFQDYYYQGFRPSLILDWGAYVGGFTNLVKAIWPEVKVIAVEADQSIADIFKENTKELSKVTLVNKALVVDDQDGPVLLNDVSYEGNEKYWEGMRFVRNRISKNLPASFSRLVPAIKATQFFREYVPSLMEEVSLLKIDLCGLEGEILTDLREYEMLERLEVIIGNYYLAPNREAIESVLCDSHDLRLERKDGPLEKGRFIALRK